MLKATVVIKKAMIQSDIKAVEIARHAKVSPVAVSNVILGKITSRRLRSIISRLVSLPPPIWDKMDREIDAVYGRRGKKGNGK